MSLTSLLTSKILHPYSVFNIQYIQIVKLQNKILVLSSPPPSPFHIISLYFQHFPKRRGRMAHGQQWYFLRRQSAIWSKWKNYVSRQWGINTGFKITIRYSISIINESQHKYFYESPSLMKASHQITPQTSKHQNIKTITSAK